MDSWAISTRFAGRRICRHPQIPGSGVALNCNAPVAQLKHARSGSSNAGELVSWSMFRARRFRLWGLGLGVWVLGVEGFRRSRVWRFRVSGFRARAPYTLASQPQIPHRQIAQVANR